MTDLVPAYEYLKFYYKFILYEIFKVLLILPCFTLYGEMYDVELFRRHVE